MRISWRHPLVSFIAEKASILQAIEDADLLRRYIVEEERVGVKLKDTSHQLVFGPEFIELAALGPDPDFDLLDAAAKLVWDGMSPTEVRRLDANFRLLAQASSDYDEARTAIGDRMVTMPNGLRNVDFAVAFDVASRNPKADIHVEWGVVNAAEAARRLAQAQPALREGLEIPPSVFPIKSLPDVAFYDHQLWRVSDIDLQTQSEIFTLWSQIREKAEEIDMALSERLAGESK